MSKVYFNDKQLEFMAAQQRIRCFMAGRGTGKSVTIGGINYQRMVAMPRAKGFWAATTYEQLLNRTMPPAIEKWKEIGLRPWNAKTGGHYVIGVRPPKSWPEPYSPPSDYQRIITFKNGYTIEMMSMDRGDIKRGGSYQFGDVDEAALLKREVVSKILLPQLRGAAGYFRGCHLYRNVNFYTSVPWLTRGYWIFDYEEKAQKDPERYFWLEATTYDNIAVLGAEYIEDLKAELSPLEFAIEVENKRMLRSTNCFYHEFDEEVHVYETNWLYGGGSKDMLQVQGREMDHDADLPIDMTFDFGGNFNGCVLLQYNESKRSEVAFDNLYVKQNAGLPKLLDKFCDKYRFQQVKFVRLWGEPQGHSRQASTGMSLFREAVQHLAKKGWHAEIFAKAKPARPHADRWRFMNKIFGEKYRDLPKIRIHQDNCKELIIALNTVDVAPDFKKSKVNEKDPNFPQEHAPHLTDALDNYIDQKYHWVDAGNMKDSSGGWWSVR